MSASATASGTSGSAFNPRVMLAIIVAGALALAAYMVLTAYSPQLAKGNNGGAHALSNGATGFSALVALTKESGIDSEVYRDEGSPGENSLLVLTPDFMTSPDDVKELVGGHQSKGPTLIILPKWETRRHPYRTGWVERVGIPFLSGLQMLPLKTWGEKLELEQDGQLSGAPSQKAKSEIAKTPFATNFPEDGRPIRFLMPEQRQSLRCGQCTDSIRYPDGKVMVAAMWDDYPVYILADPDFLNNQGLKDKTAGVAALQLLDRLAEDGNAEWIAFDVTLNGLGKQRSILRFLFEPPFLAITLCLVLAGVLAGWQAFNRFGPPARRRCEIALGKDALITSGAELMKQAGKDRHGAGVYARHMRDLLAQALKAPGGLDEAALESWLDRFTPPDMRKFSTLMQEMTRAANAEQMVIIGREMTRWRKGVLREH